MSTSRRGMSPDDARRAARRALGGIDRTKELHRDARSFIWAEEVRGDLRYAARRLAGNPGFALTVVLTVGLAVGGTGAVFSLMNVVVLEPLPYRDPGELVVIWESQANAQRSLDEVAPVNYDILTKNNEVFAALAAVTGFSATLNTAGNPERIVGRRVTHGFFDVLGVGPALGRTFRVEEDRPGAPRVVVVSHGLWRDRFGGDPGVIGQDLILDKEHYSIVGVMPAGFQFIGADAGFWTPAAFGANELARGANYLTIVARLASGTTIERAQSNLDNLAVRLATVLLPASEGFHLNVVSLHDEVAGDARRPLACTPGGGRVRHADRLRECGESADGTRRHASTRNGSPPLARSDAESNRTPAPDREPRPLRARVAGRGRPRSLGTCVPCPARATGHVQLCAADSRWPNTGRHIARGAHGRRAFWPGTGTPHDEGRSWRGSQDQRTRCLGPELRTPGSGGGRGRDDARTRRRRRALDSDPLQAAVCRSRVSAGAGSVPAHGDRSRRISYPSETRGLP